jgi:hypothetical protein
MAIRQITASSGDLSIYNCNYSGGDPLKQR